MSPPFNLLTALGLPFVFVAASDKRAHNREFMHRNFHEDMADIGGPFLPHMYPSIADHLLRENCIYCHEGRCGPRQPARIGIVCFPCQAFSSARTTGDVDEHSSGHLSSSVGSDASGQPARGKRRKTDARAEQASGDAPRRRRVPKRKPNKPRRARRIEDHDDFQVIQDVLEWLDQNRFDVAISENVLRFLSTNKKSNMFAHQTPIDWFQNKVQSLGKTRDGGSGHYAHYRCFKLNASMTNDMDRQRIAPPSRLRVPADCASQPTSAVFNMLVPSL